MLTPDLPRGSGEEKMAFPFMKLLTFIIGLQDIPKKGHQIVFPGEFGEFFE
jgi:hypothetical protein